jgi:hypothetical protein
MRIIKSFRRSSNGHFTSSGDDDDSMIVKVKLSLYQAIEAHRVVRR